MADPRELAELVQGEHTDAVAAFEDRVYAEAVPASVERRFDELVRRTVAAWTAAFGAPSAAAVPGAALSRLVAAVRAAVRRLLDGVGPRSQRALEGALAGAVLLGAGQGGAFLAAVGVASGRFPARPSRRVREAAGGLVDAVREQEDRALDLLVPGRVRRWSDVLTAIGTGRGTLGVVRRHVAWVVGLAVNEGLVADVRAAGAQKLWVAEADACVSCAAYAGLVVDVRRDFPGGLSWDPNARRYFPDPVPYPPRHPNCRCRVVAWRDEWTSRGAVPFPEWLRRQAAIAVARGASPSDSHVARVRAARELLRLGVPALPPDVARAARTAVRTGRFPARAAAA